MVKIRLDPSDEYMHPLETASNFNESMYFNVYDPERRVGGFLRLGNRANEGYAELTTCLYLPDGRVGFMFKRPEITDNDAFDAGGTRFEVIDAVRGAADELPRQDLHARRAAADGRPVARRSPRTPGPSAQVEFDAPRRVTRCSAANQCRTTAQPLSEDHSGGFASGHYEQHMSVRGTIRVGDDEWVLEGFGLRDHSWGPRYWQATAGTTAGSPPTSATTSVSWCR